MNCELQLHPIQLRALNWCNKKARIFHKNVYDNAIIKFLEMDLSCEDLIDTIEYIKNIGYNAMLNWRHRKCHGN